MSHSKEDELDGGFWVGTRPSFTGKSEATWSDSALGSRVIDTLTRSTDSRDTEPKT